MSDLSAGDVFFGDVDGVVAFPAFLALPSAKQVGGGGGAVDDGVEAFAVDVDLGREQIGADGVLACAWDDDWVVHDGQDFDGHGFGLRVVHFLGEGSAVLGGAHFARLHGDGENAVHEDLRIRVDFGFGGVFVRDAAAVRFDEPLEKVFQKGGADFGFGSDAIDARGIIGRENLLDDFD